jgi:hypothetical protein
MFVTALLSTGLINANVNPRYHFGELRLGRIEWICRLCSKEKRSIVRGYATAYQGYYTFARRNVAWLLTVFLYLTTLLTAMQVGLATDHLRSSDAFQGASWGVTVFAILSPLVVVGIISVYTLWIIAENLLFTISKKGKPRINNPIWDTSALLGYKH